MSNYINRAKKALFIEELRLIHSRHPVQFPVSQIGFLNVGYEKNKTRKLIFKMTPKLDGIIVMEIELAFKIIYLKSTYKQIIHVDTAHKL